MSNQPKHEKQQYEIRTSQEVRQPDIAELSDEELDQVAGGSLQQFFMNAEQAIGHELAQFGQTASKGLNSIGQTISKDLNSIGQTVSKDLNSIGQTASKDLGYAKETLIKGIKKL